MSFHKRFTNRNKICILRSLGGIGDIMMIRMIFEDLKLIISDIHITFACPTKYHSLVADHPFIDEIIDCKNLNKDEYALVYDISKCCVRYELAHAPAIYKHRSDIWAENCGVELTKHDMHITILEEEKQFAKQKIKQLNPENKKTLLIAPVSSMTSKNLLPEQVNGIEGFCSFIVHDSPLDYDYPVISDLNLRQFMAIVNEADYVLTVDTSTFHIRGGLKKPMVAVFGWADGVVYGKYFDFHLIQKHRDYKDVHCSVKGSSGWCGPCYNFSNCPKTNESRKPCITDITIKDIKEAINKLCTL